MHKFMRLETRSIGCHHDLNIYSGGIATVDVGIRKCSIQLPCKEVVTSGASGLLFAPVRWAEIALFSTLTNFYFK